MLVQVERVRQPVGADADTIRAPQLDVVRVICGDKPVEEQAYNLFIG